MGFFIIRQWLGYSAKNFFANNDLTDFICNKLIDKIKFSGFMGLLSETTGVSLRATVATLLLRLTGENIGVSFNVESMSAEDKRALIGIIVNQIYKSLIPKRSCCAKTGRSFANVFTAEYKPELFLVKMDKVVADVKEALQRYKERREVDAFVLQDRQPKMLVNQLHASSSSSGSGVTIEPPQVDSKSSVTAINRYKA